MAEQRSLFDHLHLPEFSPPAPPRRFDPTAVEAAPKIGPQRVRCGTSSWTYPGWNGLVYRDVRGYGGAQRFDQLCLAEYARDPRFRTAGADNMYYVAPAQRLPMLRRYREQLDGVPGGFDLCPKVWHGITVNRYSKLQQQKWRLPGEVNADFLDPELFTQEVALPLLEGLGPHLGPLILEIQENDIHPIEFARMLDRFLRGARAGSAVRICVELRTLEHLTPQYLEVLREHGAGHVLNSWTRMPPIGWQHRFLQQHGFASPLQLVRALLRPATVIAEGPAGVRLRPGSSYDEAVEAYQPYDKIVQPLPDVRADILRVIADLPDAAVLYLIVNNRLEGHAPRTIAEIQDSLTTC